MNYEVVRNDSYLQHFGIKGMKWGVWNEETRDRYLGRHKGKSSEGKVSNKKSKSDDSETHKGLTNKQKSTIKKVAIGVGVTAALVGAGYLAYKYDAIGKTKELINGKYFIENKIDKTQDFGDAIFYDGKNGYTGRNTWESKTEIIGTFSEEQLKRVDQIANNIRYVNKDAFKNQSSVQACSLNSALNILPESYQGKYSIKENMAVPADADMFKVLLNKEFTVVAAGDNILEAYDNLDFDLKLCKDKTKGVVSFAAQVKDSIKQKELMEEFDVETIPGHIVNWEKVDGGIIYYDSTTNTICDANTAFKRWFQYVDKNKIRYIAADSSSSFNEEAMNYFITYFCNKISE